MYRCQVCGSLVPPGTPCRRLILETRPKVYRRRAEVNRLTRMIKGKRKVFLIDDRGGRGFEIVREVNACPSCAERAAHAPPRSVAAPDPAVA